MKTTLTEKFIGDYGSYKVEAGTEIEIVSFPPKVYRAKGTKPFFVHGKTVGSTPLHVHVPFSKTTLSYAKCRKENKDLFLG
jgi:hypothetical protein